MNNKTLLKLFDKNIQGKFSYFPNNIKTMKVCAADHLLIIDSGLFSDMFNIICCNGKTDRLTIRKSIENFRIKQLPFAFWIGFENEPFWLEKELSVCGLITDEIEWAMICNLSRYSFNQLSPNINIKIINDQKGMQDVIDVMNSNFPDQEHDSIQIFYEQASAVLLHDENSLLLFAGYINDQPVSISSVYYQEGLASIFDVIVMPDARGKGVGKAMTLHAMQNAQKKGYNHCILTATNDAKYLYQKLGFEELKMMKVYHEPKVKFF